MTQEEPTTNQAWVPLRTLHPRASQRQKKARDAEQRISSTLANMRRRSAEFEEQIRPGFDAAPAQRPCTRHPLQLLSRDWEETIQQSWPERELTVAYAKCPACLEDEETARRREYWARRGVPGRVLDATLGNFDTKSQESLINALESARLFAGTSPKRGGFLFLLGETGLGKGHLATAIMKTFGDGLFETHGDLLGRLRDTYGTSGTQAFTDRYKKAPCFVLDEVGVSVGGKDEAPFLYSVLSARYENRLPTIITSNEELKVIIDLLGYRLHDRMRDEYRVIAMKGTSHRGASASSSP